MLLSTVAAPDATCMLMPDRQCIVQQCWHLRTARMQQQMNPKVHGDCIVCATLSIGVANFHGANVLSVASVELANAAHIGCPCLSHPLLSDPQQYLWIYSRLEANTDFCEYPGPADPHVRSSYSTERTRKARKDADICIMYTLPARTLQGCCRLAIISLLTRKAGRRKNRCKPGCDAQQRY